MPKSPITDFDAFINNYVGDDWYSPCFRELSEPFSRLSRVKRNALLRACRATTAKGADDFTLSLVKDVLIGMYPQSLPLMEELLLERRERHIWNFQYVLFFGFSFFDNLSLAFRVDIERLISRFLMSVPSNAGFAAWKAAHCLGDDWPIARALPILVRVCRDARFAAGRSAAAMSLSDLAERTSSSANHRRIVSALEDVVASDRSENVRVSANLALERISRDQKLSEAQTIT